MQHLKSLKTALCLLPSTFPNLVYLELGKAANPCLWNTEHYMQGSNFQSLGKLSFVVRGFCGTELHVACRIMWNGQIQNNVGNRGQLVALERAVLKRYMFGCNFTKLHLNTRQDRCFYVKPNVHSLIGQNFVDENIVQELPSALEHSVTTHISV